MSYEPLETYFFLFMIIGINANYCVISSQGPPFYLCFSDITHCGLSEADAKVMVNGGAMSLL